MPSTLPGRLRKLIAELSQLCRNTPGANSALTGAGDEGLTLITSLVTERLSEHHSAWLKAHDVEVVETG